jgi:hypothetical protein
MIKIKTKDIKRSKQDQEVVKIIDKEVKTEEVKKEDIIMRKRKEVHHTLIQIYLSKLQKLTEEALNIKRNKIHHCLFLTKSYKSKSRMTTINFGERLLKEKKTQIHQLQ